MPHKYFIHFRPDDGTGAGSGGEGGNGGEGSGAPAGEPQGGNSGGQAADETRERELTEVRNEAARRRTENAKLKERIAELEGAGQTELQKKDAAITEQTEKVGTLEATNRALRVRVLAGQAGISDPKAAEDAASLLDWSKVEDPDEDKSVVKALKELVKDRSYLSGNIAGGGDGGEGGGGRVSGSDDMNARIREAAGRG
jgi:hypothetical protein